MPVKKSTIYNWAGCRNIQKQIIEKTVLLRERFFQVRNESLLSELPAICKKLMGI